MSASTSPARVRSWPIPKDPEERKKQLSLWFVQVSPLGNDIPAFCKDLFSSEERIISYDMKGGSKYIYKMVDDKKRPYVVSIEHGGRGLMKRRSFVGKRLNAFRKTLNPALQPLLVVSTDLWGGFMPNLGYELVISEMKYCDMDVFQYIQEEVVNMGKENQQPPFVSYLPMFKNMTRVLAHLHDNGMYLMDIKLGNMLWCGSSTNRFIAFVDLEEVLFIEEEYPVYKSVTDEYSYQIELLMSTVVRTDDKWAKQIVLQMVDWYAFSLCFKRIMDYLFYFNQLRKEGDVKTFYDQCLYTVENGRVGMEARDKLRKQLESMSNSNRKMWRELVSKKRKAGEISTELAKEHKQCKQRVNKLLL